jgi:hypothetical protein
MDVQDFSRREMILPANRPNPPKIVRICPVRPKHRLYIRDQLVVQIAATRNRFSSLKVV